MCLARPFDGGIFSIDVGKVPRSMPSDGTRLNHLDGAIPCLTSKLPGVVLRASAGGSGEDGLALHCRADDEKPESNANPLNGYADAIPDEGHQQGQDDASYSEGDTATRACGDEGSTKHPERNNRCDPPRGRGSTEQLHNNKWQCRSDKACRKVG